MHHHYYVLREAERDHSAVQKQNETRQALDQIALHRIAQSRGTLPGTCAFGVLDRTWKLVDKAMATDAVWREDGKQRRIRWGCASLDSRTNKSPKRARCSVEMNLEIAPVLQTRARRGVGETGK